MQSNIKSVSVVEMKVLDNRYLLDRNFKYPKYQTEGAAAVDLQACTDGDVVIKAGESLLIGTGLALHIGDSDYVGMVYPRSGLGSKHGIVLGNGTGVVDADYLGELKVCLWNRSDKDFTVEEGMRIAQYMVIPVQRVKFKFVEDFSQDSERGSGGFGSTGV